jgi:hypothetical protein
MCFNQLFCVSCLLGFGCAPGQSTQRSTEKSYAAADSQGALIRNFCMAQSIPPDCRQYTGLQDLAACLCQSDNNDAYKGKFASCVDVNKSIYGDTITDAPVDGCAPACTFLKAHCFDTSLGDQCSLGNTAPTSSCVCGLPASVGQSYVSCVTAAASCQKTATPDFDGLCAKP